MENQSNANVDNSVSTDETLTSTNKTSIPTDKTLTEQPKEKNLSKQDKPRSWSILWGILGAVGIISSIVGLVVFVYENYTLPTLRDELSVKEKEINKLNKEIADLNSSSEVLRLTKLVQEQENQIKGKDDLITSQKLNINEINTSRSQLKQQVDKLNADIENWKSWYQKYSTDLNMCKKDLDLKRDIADLRKKIESNNNQINRNDYYKPTDRQVNTWIMDNQNLNAMIAEYQKKLQCQNLP
ncbi:hypothetical protein [Lonepinella sp. BR2904]|uniref:hypothetical protein n=1 Tax=Lonepinella sp. BR2904 TaxID=3434551 RepID=UPI003F6E4166